MRNPVRHRSYLQDYSPARLARGGLDEIRGQRGLRELLEAFGAEVFDCLEGGALDEVRGRRGLQELIDAFGAEVFDCLDVQPALV